MREVLLSKDPRNIQILKAFSIENAISGLCLLLEKAIQEQDYLVTTVVLDEISGEVTEKTIGKFDLEHLYKENSIVLF
jgi:hypothetical protein